MRKDFIQANIATDLEPKLREIKGIKGILIVFIISTLKLIIADFIENLFKKWQDEEGVPRPKKYFAVDKDPGVNTIIKVVEP